MAFQVSLDFEGLPDALKAEAPASLVQQEAIRAVNEGTIIVGNAMREASPLGAIGALRAGWDRIPATVKGKIVRGKVTNPTVQANVIEKGATQHFPPVRPDGEPALAAWIRRALPRKTTPFVIETIGKKKVRRPANLSDPEDVRKIAFKIGQAIQSRGLPSRQGKPKRFFTRIFRKLESQITAIMKEMEQRITERLSEE
ncbi:hypothetical protein LCGC14_1437150 [marine sediment metagenome]|uniref:Uncharacterized protein n=1 Tax=marine sediment metagenome TaxID=412755 RepID=A0A0F9K824_9ZZZZ